MKEATELTGTIERTLRALQCVAESGAFSAKDVATQVGIPTSTAYRLLQTLSQMNFVEKSTHGAYRIGREYVRLASLVTSTYDYETISEPFLQDLSQQFHETCAFALYLPKQHAYMIAHVHAAKHPLQFVVERFMPRSMVRGALGRAMLPFLPREDLLAAYEAEHSSNLPELSQPSQDELALEFEEIHRQGCFIGISPNALGANSTVAPVFNSKGQVLGSVGIAIPNVRFDPTRQPEISAAVIAAARGLSAVLGYGDRSPGRF